ncbi:MAG: MarC family protein [Lentisphaeria bacterium]|nr:MarC family protein [Lentisphaeria bacterium]
MTVSSIIGVFVKIFFLLTPFFVLSVYVTLTRDEEEMSRRKLAVRTTVAVLVITMILYLFGEQIFRYLGITLDAFRIGSGIVLLLSGIEVVRGSGIPTGVRQSSDDGDISVVPLAIPYTVGPGTVGTLLVMGAGAPSTEVRITEILGIIFAVCALGLLLFFSNTLEKVLKRKGLNILSKLTGLFLAALASQIIFEGIKNIMRS